MTELFAACSEGLFLPLRRSEVVGEHNTSCEENFSEDTEETNTGSGNGDTNSSTGIIPPQILNDSCDKECCDDQSVSYQSFDVESSRRKQGKQNRIFQKQWFSDHKWLSYCLTCNAVFCFYCRKVTSQRGITFSKRGDASFILTEFCNWKKGKEKLRVSRNEPDS